MKNYSEKKLFIIEGKILKWHGEFEKERGYKSLTRAQKDASELLVCVFSDFMYIEHLQEPKKWQPDALEKVCIESIPQNVFSGSWIFQSVEPVLSAFFDFLQKKNIINNAKELKKRLRSIIPVMLKEVERLDKESPEKVYFRKAFLSSCSPQLQ